MIWNNCFIIGKGETDAKGTVDRVGEKIGRFTGDGSYGGSVYLESLTLPDETVDECIEYVLTVHPRLFVGACENLTEVGLIEARFHLSPVMLLHKLGLLDENCTVVGANYLDNDDIALMAQCGAKAVLCPSYACGKGFGFPAVRPMLGKIEVGLGTMDNSFNKCGSVIDEARLLLLGTNCTMRSDEALKISELSRLIGFTGSDLELKALLNVN